MHLTRRRLVTAAGVAGIGGLAGCLGGDTTGETAGAPTDGEADGVVARSSFFVFGDITAQVAGDAATAELLVPVGQHGHGWEPGPRIREEIRGADLFVHGMPGFQPWVDDIARDLAADGADVTAVDVTAGIDLLDTGSGHDHGNDGTHDDHDDEKTHDDHDDEKTHDDHDGEKTRDDHADDGTHDGHDHGGGADPHFWMDPLRVADAVANVRRGLTAVDEGNADAYAENADAFRSRLDDLHDRIASTVADGSNGTVLVAGHNAHRYLAARYGLDVVSLTGASPDDRPTARDVERARRLVEERGLRYVCADPLESQRAAEQLVAETAAEAVLPLTAMPGLTDEWKANDWGYVDVMERVNLPTLERVLDA